MFSNKSFIKTLSKFLLALQIFPLILILTSHIFSVRAPIGALTEKIWSCFFIGG